MVGEKKNFFDATLARWKTPSWERNISERDVIQHTQITIENFLFLLVYHKLGWDMALK